MKGYDLIATIVLVLAMIGVVVLKFIQLEVSFEAIAIFVVIACIATGVYVRSKRKRKID